MVNVLEVFSSSVKLEISGGRLNEESIDSRDNKVSFHPKLFRACHMLVYHSYQLHKSNIFYIILYMCFSWDLPSFAFHSMKCIIKV